MQAASGEASGTGAPRSLLPAAAEYPTRAPGLLPTCALAAVRLEPHDWSCFWVEARLLFAAFCWVLQVVSLAEQDLSWALQAAGTLAAAALPARASASSSRPPWRP